MRIVIDYHEKVAYVSGAYSGDPFTDPANTKEYSLKYVKRKVQQQAKADGFYGLEFWIDRRPPLHVPQAWGEFTFSILDMYHRI